MNNQPYIILVQPQLAENVGMTARAMMNSCIKPRAKPLPACKWSMPLRRAPETR